MLKNSSFVLSVCFTVLFCSFSIVNAATPTVITDAESLDRSRNLVVNGSFEEPHLVGIALFGLLTGVDGDGYFFLSAGASLRLPPHALPDGWTTSGGGIDTDARWGNNYNAVPGLPVAGQAWSSTEIHGERSVYLGNATPAEISETPQYMSNGEVAFTSPPTITLRF